MKKITFLGAGSTIFAKNILGDTMLTDALCDSLIALYDIDASRLKESEILLNHINRRQNNGRATIESYDDRIDALRDADFVINAIQVGGYEPCTVSDFEIPKKYGIKQTIGDTSGIGGIFRALRTIPVMLDLAEDMEKICPDAWLFNYANPMGMVIGAMLKHTNVRTVGLCHSVQTCADELLTGLGMESDNISYKIAGINHMGWLLDIRRNGRDLYPEIRKRAGEKKGIHNDMVRFELLKTFGYYVTESSEHSAEYYPYFIKSAYEELIEEYNIPIDLYLQRCVDQIQGWEEQKKELMNENGVKHVRSIEYISYIMEAISLNKPYTFGGNVLNKNILTNLPNDCCIEVSCVADGNGVTPTYVGALPEQLAALNRTNINVQTLTIKAAISKRKEDIYHAALLDPHTASELPVSVIKNLCDDLISAHGHWLSEFH